VAVSSRHRQNLRAVVLSPAVDGDDGGLRYGAARTAPHVIEAMVNHRSGIIRTVTAVYNCYANEMERGVALGQWARHAELILALPVTG
jgi:hypothetical protein